MADVNDKMVKVLQGFAALSYEERVELLKQIQEYQARIDDRPKILKSFAERAGVPLGPTGHGSCPCCGR